MSLLRLTPLLPEAYGQMDQGEARRPIVLVKLKPLFLAKPFVKSIFHCEAMVAYFCVNREKCSRGEDLHFSLFTQK